MSIGVAADPTLSGKGYINIDGTAAVTIGTTGIESGYADLSVPQAALETAPAMLTAQTINTSGVTTHIDYTSIPPWAKRITVTGTAITTAASSAMLVRIGTVGGLLVTGYTSTAMSGTTAVTNTTGFVMPGSSVSAASFTCDLINIDGNVWSCSITNSYSGSNAGISHGYATLSGSLSQLSVVLTSGTFSAGTFNVRIEP